MLKAAYCTYRLQFREPAITSRAIMHDKLTYFIKIWDSSTPDIYGIGECALFRGLSADDKPDYEDVLANVCRNISHGKTSDQIMYSSIRFGLETAMADLANGGHRTPFPTPWSDGTGSITINGLVWMGSAQQMRRRVEEKIEAGFRCLKFKIGGIDFNEELKILNDIRYSFPPDTLEIRLDANGAFTPDDALTKLSQLNDIGIHSIEQPIRQHQWHAMSHICRLSPIPIALDEELIGISDKNSMRTMLSAIKPQYIILKPALCGGFSGARQWIDTAEALGIGWWITSALESNIGLNAIAQWTAAHHPTIPQGLGTGALYVNNIDSPICRQGQQLSYDPRVKWQIPALSWITPE